MLVERSLWIADLHSDFTSKILNCILWFREVVLYLCCIISSCLVFCLTIRHLWGVPLCLSDSALFLPALQFFQLEPLFMQLPSISGVGTWQCQAALCRRWLQQMEHGNLGRKAKVITSLAYWGICNWKRTHAGVARTTPRTSFFIFNFTFRVKIFQLKKNKQKWPALLSQMWPKGFNQ